MPVCSGIVVKSGGGGGSVFYKGACRLLSCIGGPTLPLLGQGARWPGKGCFSKVVFYRSTGQFSVPKIGTVFGADFREQQSDTQRSVTFFGSLIWVVFLGSKIGPRPNTLFDNHWVHRVEIFAHMAGGGYGEPVRVVSVQY